MIETSLPIRILNPASASKTPLGYLWIRPAAATPEGKFDLSMWKARNLGACWDCCSAGRYTYHEPYPYWFDEAINPSPRRGS